MNGNENNFETVRQLLKLKQHEIPPPGYFNNFSSQVISRIRAGEEGGTKTFMERLQITAPWLVGFLQIFETRPGIIGAFATSLCLVLGAGLFFAEQSDSAPKTSPVVAENTQPIMDSITSASPAPLLAATDPSSGITVNTNPVLSLQPSANMFGQQNPLFQSASFATPVGR